MQATGLKIWKILWSQMYILAAADKTLFVHVILLKKHCMEVDQRFRKTEI